MFGSKLGVLFVNLSVFPMVALLGQGNDRRGFMLLMPIYASGSAMLYLLAFFNLREVEQDSKHRLSIEQSLSALRGNAPWLIIFISSLLFWIAFVARISSGPYFFQYVMHHKELTAVANSLDVVSLGTILFLPLLCRRFSKTSVWVVGLLGSVGAQVVVYLGANAHSIPLVLSGWTLGFLASGVAMAMPFSILSDSVDYGEWKSGVRAAGLLTAVGAAFCLKAGSGLGGALPAWILQACSYVPNVEQSQGSLFGISFSFIWLPAICYGMAAFPVFFYRKYERLEPGIRSDLEQRRSLATALNAATIGSGL
jgi:Na+/melibiose symporter-like transporter